MIKGEKMHKLHFNPGSVGHHGCCTPHGRHFISKKEKKEMLAKYKEQLEKELEGVTVKIEEIEKKGS